MKTHHAHALKENNESEDKLYQAIAAIKTIEDAKIFFQDLCTPNEIQAMADRWQVVPFIKAGVPYRKIYDETGVSATTVGRVARCMMLGGGGYNMIYERVEKKQNGINSKAKNRNPKKRALK